MVFNEKILRGAAPPSNLSLKTTVLVGLITKCNCEHAVSCQNLAVQKTTSSEKVVLAKKYKCSEKVVVLKK